jgi:hypothetical protein
MVIGKIGRECSMQRAFAEDDDMIQASAPFTNLAGQTLTTLSLTTSASQNGNQYRAVFTNSGGSATTTAAALTVDSAPPVVSYSVLFGSQSYNFIGPSRNRLPWQITGISVTFSKPITTGSVSSLGGVTATMLSGLGTSTLTWSINPVALGALSTTLAGSGPNALKDAAGNALSGGAGFAQALKIFEGDFNDDGAVNAQDFVLINTRFCSSTTASRTSTAMAL